MPTRWTRDFAGLARGEGGGRQFRHGGGGGRGAGRSATTAVAAWRHEVALNRGFLPCVEGESQEPRSLAKKVSRNSPLRHPLFATHGACERPSRNVWLRLDWGGGRRFRHGGGAGRGVLRHLLPGSGPPALAGTPLESGKA